MSVGEVQRVRNSGQRCQRRHVDTGHGYEYAPKEFAFDQSASVWQSVHIMEHWVQGVVTCPLEKDFSNQVSVKIIVELNEFLLCKNSESL